MTRRFSVYWLLVMSMAFASAPVLAAADDDSDWTHEATVYLWYPDVDGTLSFDTPAGNDVSIDAGDILDKLDFAFMGLLESRKGPWSVVADVIYLDLSDTNNGTLTLTPLGGGISSQVDLEMDGWITSLMLGHALHRDSSYQVDIAGGMRYLDMDTDITWTPNGPLPPSPPPRTLSQSAQALDIIFGLRGRYAFNESWSLRYHLDMGVGDSDLTWQAAGGVVWDLSWGNIKMLYRHLEYDVDDGLFQDVSFSGPLLGVGFRF